MTVRSSIDRALLLEEYLSRASPDLLRALMQSLINALLSADADTVCGAEYGDRSEHRVNSRNGYRHRDFDTRVGTLDVAIPKLRESSYFPEWFLERRKRAEQALTTVVAERYLRGVSTQRMDKTSPDPRDHRPVEVPGQRDGQGPRRARRSVPHTVPDPSWAVHVRGR